MPFPKTLAELIAAGYELRHHADCSACHAAIEFWRTPTGKLMPINFMADTSSEVVSHFATCPQANRFRRQR